MFPARTFVAALVAGGAFMAAAGAAAQSVTRTDLMQATIGAADGVEVVSYLVEGPAGGGPLPRHRHPGDEFLYVLEGAVRLDVDGREPVTVSQGEMFHLPYMTPHSAGNASATEPASVLVFQVIEAGKPVTENLE